MRQSGRAGRRAGARARPYALCASAGTPCGTIGGSTASGSARRAGLRGWARCRCCTPPVTRQSKALSCCPEVMLSPSYSARRCCAGRVSPCCCGSDAAWSSPSQWVIELDSAASESRAQRADGMRSAAQLLRRVMAAAEEVDQTVRRQWLKMVDKWEAAEVLQACS